MNAPDQTPLESGSDAVIESIARSYHDARRRGEPVQIDDFLHATGADSSSLLFKLVHTDLDLRLAAGEPVRIEAYAQRYPQLANDLETFRRLIAAEYTLRRRHDASVALDEYAQRFPHHHAFLSTVFGGRNEATPAADHDPHLTRANPVLEHKFAPAALDDDYPNVPGHEVLGTLGRGGMGIVYKARHQRLGRLVAVKMILADAQVGAEERERFCREAEAVARLQHPGIVQVYEVGETEGRPFFSLEYVPGGSLNKQIAGKPQPPHQAAELIEKLAQAMQAAHASGIIHRDLKPANVLLAADGSPKITDFGLAKQLDNDTGQTRSGVIMGTPSYMAPEQAVGQVVGPAADIYALGVILYELLTGRPPFLGTDLIDTLDQVKNAEPLPPSRLQPKVPRDVETICLKCLQKEPAKRYTTSLELAQDLRRYLDGEPIRARRAGLVERGVKYARRRPLVVGAWGLAIAFVLSAAAGVSYYFYREMLDAEAQLAKLQELEERRAGAGAKIHESETAVRQRDWPAALSAANEAGALLGDDPALADLRDRARRLQGDVARIQQFARHNDQAKFHEVLAAEEGEQERHAKAAKEEAQAGLALLGLSADRAGPPELGDSLTAAQTRAQAAEACYELYLTWANALAMNADEASAKAALRILDRAPALGVKTQAYHLRRARLLAQLNDKAAAQHELEEGAKLAPAGAIDHFLLGLELYRLRNLDQALHHLKAALELDPDHFWARYYLAGCYLRTRRSALAHGPLSVCIRMKPDFVWPYLLRGFVNGELEDFEAAAADFDKADKLAPDDVARYGILTNRGVVRVRQGKLDEAIADFEKAIALRPKQYQAHANLADVYLRQGKPEAALAALDRALQLQPLAALYRTRAKLHLQRGAFAEARPDLEQAIARSAGTRSFDLGRDYLELGRIHYRQGQMGDALTCFDRALAAVPDKAASVFQQQELARFQAEAEQLRGEAFLELNRFADAVASLEKSMKLAPATATHHRARGLARAKLNRYGEAIEDYTRALELDRAQEKPADPRTYCYRGWAYIINEAPKLAQRDFDEALKLPKADLVDCHNGRGYAQVLLGQWKAAVADADEAVKLKPELPRHLYNAARIYALAVGKAVAEPGQDDRPMQELRQRYELQAVKLIRAALDKVPTDQRAAFWNEYIKADPALKPIRRGALYSQLASAMAN